MDFGEDIMGHPESNEQRTVEKSEDLGHQRVWGAVYPRLRPVFWH